jgi:isopenicillin N synthase-like dioxygenase
MLLAIVLRLYETTSFMCASPWTEVRILRFPKAKVNRRENAANE